MQLEKPKKIRILHILKCFFLISAHSANSQNILRKQNTELPQGTWNTCWNTNGIFQVTYYTKTKVQPTKIKPCSDITHEGIYFHQIRFFECSKLREKDFESLLKRFQFVTVKFIFTQGLLNLPLIYFNVFNRTCLNKVKLGFVLILNNFKFIKRVL